MGHNMRITDLLDKNSISLNAAPADKKETLDLAVELMAKSGKLSDVEKYREQVYAREEESTTGIGEGIAIPHGKCDAVKAPGLAAMVIKNGVEYESLDGEPVTLLFLIAAPNTKDNVHLDVLSKLSVMLMDENFTTSLRNAKSVDEFLQIIDAADESAKSIDDRLSDTGITTEKKKGFKLLAVTSCPTGIAHTYMAAEALEKAARAADCQIKIETRGSAGAKNVLTAEEIEAADCIIVAADAKVPMDRFNGKKVISCQVSDGIGKADQLVKQAMSGNVEVFHGESSETTTAVTGKESAAHKIYTQLMNGVSHMLPFVVGGGVLIALGFLIDTLAGNANAGGNFGQTNPVAAVIFWIGKAAFSFMIPILAGYIAQSIADRPGLLPGIVGGYLATIGATLQSPTGDDKAVSGFLGALLAGFVAGLLVNGLKKAFSWMPKSMDGIKPVFLYPLFGTVLIGLFMLLINPFVGYINLALSAGLKSLGETSRILLSVVLAAMMATDMGGPFNKAAYVFGTASLATGDTWIMAAVMIGGMVPPIAIALSTTFNKKKWTKEELKSGPVNYAMGLCFITEGAIPYAASDPLRVIPSCMVGSAVAGLVCALFGCACPAPHGGVFTFAVVDHPLGYIVALVAGSVVGALMLALLKKNKTEKERA